MKLPAPRSSSNNKNTANNSNYISRNLNHLFKQIVGLVILSCLDPVFHTAQDTFCKEGNVCVCLHLTSRKLNKFHGGRVLGSFDTLRPHVRSNQLSTPEALNSENPHTPETNSLETLGTKKTSKPQILNAEALRQVPRCFASQLAKHQSSDGALPDAGA